MATQPDSRQIKKRLALTNLGTGANATVESILDNLNTEANSPLRMYASSTPDAKLNFASSSLSRADAANAVASPVKKQIFSGLNSPWINFQTQAISSASDFDISWPSSNTVGRYRNVGFTLIGSGKIKALFSSEAVSEGALSNPGALFVNGGLPIGYITLQCTDTLGYFKTSGSLTNIIENNKIFRLAAGGGASSSSSGSGSGGGELTDLLYRAAIRDSFVDIPDGTTTVDITSGKTDATLHDVANELIRINYDASKTISGTGTAITISGTPSFTIKQGDIIVCNSEARRITALSSQTSVTIETGFTVDPSSSAACISQAIHTVDLNNFTAGGTGLAASSQFTGNIDEVMVGYADSETLGDIIPDFGSAPVVGFDVSANGTSWSGVKIRQTSLSSSEAIASAPTASTNLYLRFFANKASGTGAVNLLSYKVFFHKQVGQIAGSSYYTAFARPTSGIAQNCSHGVVNGKSRFTFTWSYTRGLNPTEASGSALDVIVNGQILPRYIASVTDTAGGYFTEISDNVIEMDTDYSSYGVDFQFRVKSLNIIDTNTNNTSRISNLENYAQSVTDLDRVMLPTRSVPNTTIIGRANVTDFSADLSTIMGVSRVMTQQSYLIQNEFGANGENVYGVVGDLHNMIRLVGSGWTNTNSTYGSGVNNTLNDYVEVTFYGTGLNLLSLNDNSNRDIRVSVDGGAEGSNLFTGFSTVLLNRNYAANVVIPVVTGLSLGFHTVKLRINNATGGAHYSGFEILNQRTDLLHNPGSMFSKGNKVTTSASSTSSYNSGFESGTLGTRGGRVLVYQKSDGTIAKALTPVNTSAAYLTSADHTNEEIARTYHFREFGAGRSDDFSLSYTAPANLAFTLDDGTTTLVGNALATNNVIQNTNVVGFNSNTGFIALTFVGTGLDITAAYAGGTFDTHTLTIDGVSQGNLSTPLTGLSNYKICSGLPYGTHTIKIARTTTGNNGLNILAFKVYQPKKPTLPNGSVEIADYNIMTNFVANTVSTTGIDSPSIGIIRKVCKREFLYSGTWSTLVSAAEVAPTEIAGQETNSQVNGAYFQYTFWGTGFELRFRADTNRSNNNTVLLNGLIPNTTNYPTSSSTFYGSGTYTSSTGVLNQNGTQSESGLIISGLPLGLYTVKVTNNTANFLVLNTLDVITPIHSAKSQLPFDLQNTLTVGSSSISDSRKIKNDLKKDKNIVQAVGIITSPTTTSTVPVPCPDMSVTHLNTTGKIRISYNTMVQNSGASTSTTFVVLVNGTRLDLSGSISAKSYQTFAASSFGEVSDTMIINVPVGFNKIDIYWFVQGSTGTIPGIARNLTVEEI